MNKLIFILSALICWHTLPALDKIILDTGAELTGTVTENCPEYLVLSQNGKTMRIEKEQVKSLLLDIDKDKYFLAAQVQTNLDSRELYLKKSIASFPGQDYNTAALADLYILRGTYAAAAELVKGKTAAACQRIQDFLAHTGQSVAMDMVTVPAGVFPLFQSLSNPPPMYQTVSSFRIAKHEVTQSLYEAITGKNPSKYKNFPDSPGRPVDSVSWYDAVVFCNKLSMRDGLPPVYALAGDTDPALWGEKPKRDDYRWLFIQADWKADGYRLPTDMEWQFAARGSRQNLPEEIMKSIDEYGWFSPVDFDRSKIEQYTARPAGLKKPDLLGLYDIFGNVNEWCWDWANLGGFYMGNQTNYHGAEAGIGRVMHGGSSMRPAITNVGYFALIPYQWGENIGFRLARTITAPGQKPDNSQKKNSYNLISPDIIGTWKAEWNNGNNYIINTYFNNGKYLEQQKNKRKIPDTDSYDEFSGAWMLNGDLLSRMVQKNRAKNGEQFTDADKWKDLAALVSQTACIINGKLYAGDLVGRRQGSGSEYTGTFINIDTTYKIDRRIWVQRIMTINESDIHIAIAEGINIDGPWAAHIAPVTAKITLPADGKTIVSESTDPKLLRNGSVPVVWNNDYLVIRRSGYSKQED
ncbi:MAG TPA: hypothetical protein DC049_14095 [Spirochaetia bacterium]|nr:hypothetical protein [Spirochaetia bacterium]